MDTPTVVTHAPLYLRYLHRMIEGDIIWETAGEQARIDAVALFNRIFPPEEEKAVKAAGV